MAQEVAGSSLVYHPITEYTEARFGVTSFFSPENKFSLKKSAPPLALARAAASRRPRASSGLWSGCLHFASRLRSGSPSLRLSASLRRVAQRIKYLWLIGGINNCWAAQKRRSASCLSSVALAEEDAWGVVASTPPLGSVPARRRFAYRLRSAVWPGLSSEALAN